MQRFLSSCYRPAAGALVVTRFFEVDQGSRKQEAMQFGSERPYHGAPVRGRFRSAQELVIGQATTFAPFTGDEVQKARELSNRLKKKAYLAFTTLNEIFSADEKRLLLELSGEGHKSS